MHKYNYLKVSPPAMISNRIVDIYIDIRQHPIEHLSLYKKMLEFAKRDESMSWEAVENDMWAKVPHCDIEQEKWIESIHEAAAHQWCELLNYVLIATGKEITGQSYVELVVDLPLLIEDMRLMGAH